MRIPQHSTRGSAYDIPMTPMIDVVFLLLVYFVWTASFQLAEYRLPSAVSVAGTSAASASDTPPPEADFEQIVVRVLWEDAGPAWRVNEQPVADLASVRETLSRIARIQPEVPVVLHPDAKVPVGHVIEAYDAARQAGFPRVRFAAARSPRP